MINKEIAKHLNDIADLYELTEEELNAKKTFAYRKAAETIEKILVDITTLDYAKLKGIGPSIQNCIKEYAATKTTQKYQELIKIVPPPSVMELTSLSGVTSSIAKNLYKKYGTKDLSEFGVAIEKGLITSKELIDAYKVVQRAKERMLYQDAVEIAQGVFQTLSELDCVKKLEYAGSLIRCCPTVHDVNLLCATTDKKLTTEWFLKWAEKTLEQKDSKITILVKGLRICLEFCEEKEWGSCSFHLVGSKEYNAKNKELAKKKGMSLSEHGLILPGDRSGRDRSAKIISDTQENICKELGIPYLVPELRDLAGVVGLPDKLDLVNEKDIVGDFHVHTSASGGVTSGSVPNYAREVANKGYKFLAFTDYGKGYPGGKNVVFEKQSEEIELNKKSDTKLLKGIELSIGIGGNLYYTPKELEKFDMVIAGIHEGLNEKELIQTGRLVSAIRSGVIKIIAHPGCEEYGKCEGIKVNWDVVFEECVRNNVALEISGDLKRIGFKPELLWQAKQAGVKFALTSGAHSISSLPNILYAVYRARRGGITKGDLYII